MSPRTKWILFSASAAIIALSFVPTGRGPRGTIAGPVIPEAKTNSVTVVRLMESFVPPPKPVLAASFQPWHGSVPPEAAVLNVHFDVPEPASGPQAPMGRLIRCKLVNSIESIRIETPIIGFVTDDVRFNGDVIIPANTEIHGKAQADRTRDRISGHQEWNLVFRDGRHLRFKGVLLNREFDLGQRSWGSDDGSAGLKGEIIRGDNHEKMLLFLTAAASGFAQSMQSRQSTPWGMNAPIASAGNAGLNAASTVMDTWAKEIWESIKHDGPFVRVPGGSEFYVYSLDALKSNP